MPSGIIFSVTQNSFLSRPIGSHRIAHYLRNLGWDIEVIDWANWWTLDQLKELFKSRYTSDIVFVGFSHLFSMWTPMMEEFCIWIKQNYSNVKSISGSSVNPMFNSDQIDYYIQGFGEHAIVELLRYIQGNGKAPSFSLTAPGGKKIISAIQNYPAFPMSSLMVEYQDRDFIEPDEWLTIEVARGCKFECAFCNFPVLGVKGDYTRDAVDFYAQLQNTYDKFGTSCYVVADETFNDSSQKIIKFANAVEKLNFRPWFSGYLRTDLLISHSDDKEELLKMNFLGHYYGVESFNNKSARAIGKGMDSDRLKHGLLDIKQYFKTHGTGRYRGSMGLIAGLPYETKETLYDTFNWLIQNWQGHSFSMHPLSIPSSNQINQESKITKNLVKYGYKEISSFDLESKYINETNKLFTNFSHIVEPGLRKNVVDDILWESENMNVFDATKICKDIIDKKENYDFRPSCHGLSYKLTSSKNLDQKLSLDFLNFNQQFDYNIERYITKKLNFK